MPDVARLVPLDHAPLCRVACRELAIRTSRGDDEDLLAGGGGARVAPGGDIATPDEDERAPSNMAPGGDERDPGGTAPDIDDS
jgi:hypothetical protein